MSDPSPSPAGARPRILCVDDEPHILSALSRQLRRSYDVTVADVPEEALELVAQGGFEVIVSDERMPGLSGHEFLAEAREKAPDAIRILMTGQASAEDVSNAVNKSGIFRYLQKPCPDEELKAAIEAGLAERRTQLRKEDARRKTEAQNFRFAEYNRKLSLRYQRTNQELSETSRQIRRHREELTAHLARLMEWVDPVLYGHCHRVQQLSIALAQRLELTEEERLAVSHAALLHDIGKLRPDIERNNDLEGSNGHAELGTELFGDGDTSSYMVRCIRHHHERVDGHGGPGGLVRERIPLGARVIAVANAFDHALYPDVNRELPDKQEALDEVRKQASRSLDPLIVSLLAEVVSAPSWQPVEALASVDAVEVRPGLELARSLRTRDGKIVAPAGHKLREPDADRVRRLGKSGSITARLVVRHPRRA